MFGLIVMIGCSGPQAEDHPQDMPALRKNADAIQLLVDGEPFVALAGELHNSSASDLTYMAGIWDRLERSGLNTVILPVSWELVEPVEGQYDFSLVDGLIEGARAHGFKLIITWFGSWKNGDSSYVPFWVKRDRSRFPRAENAGGETMNALSVFSTESRDADARAFAALMRHIRRIDEGRYTVIMVQVQNEVGLLGASRDHSAPAQRAFSAEVPRAFISGLRQRSESGRGLALERRRSQGMPESGTWTQVFGDGPEVDEIFMSWHYARYLDAVAEAGKKAYPLPLFANAWLVSPGEDDPGDYPSGGPIARELVVWQIGAPHLDALAPDIYLEDFKRVTAAFHRDGNPLIIPEATGDVWFELDTFRRFESSRNVFWAIAEHDGLVFAPFGIEGLDLHDPLFDSYKLLDNLMPLITAAQGTGRMAGILETRTGPESVLLRFDPYLLTVRFNQKRTQDDVAYGLVIQVAADRFLFAGEGYTITVAGSEKGTTAAIRRVEEGKYVAGKWSAGRRLNGDETAQHRRIQVPPTTWDSYDDDPAPRALMASLFLSEPGEIRSGAGLQDLMGTQQE